MEPEAVGSVHRLTPEWPPIDVIGRPGGSGGGGGGVDFRDFNSGRGGGDGGGGGGGRVRACCGEGSGRCTSMSW